MRETYEIHIHPEEGESKELWDEIPVQLRTIAKNYDIGWTGLLEILKVLSQVVYKKPEEERRYKGEYRDQLSKDEVIRALNRERNLKQRVEKGGRPSKIAEWYGRWDMQHTEEEKERVLRLAKSNLSEASYYRLLKKIRESRTSESSEGRVGYEE